MKKLENIKAVIFDWAGTIIDYGCIAPTQVFIEVFQKRGIEVTIEEARTPMGLAKKDHVRALTLLCSVQQQWLSRYDSFPGESDVDELYAELEPSLAKIVKNFSDPIPGAIELIESLKSQGVKVGTTTGYVSEMMDNIIPLATSKGLIPDAVVNSSEVIAGRPAPWMIYRNCEELNVYPLSHIVKIGDTVADIQEGINAAMWTIGVTKSGNEVGLNLEESELADPEWLEAKIRQAGEKLLRAGADYIAEGVWDCMPILEEIDLRIAIGRK
jgi:phosphonoacetaldehyde hydrolase